MKNNIKYLRTKLNMTQADVLIKTGIPITTISGLETGRRNIKDITLETAIKLADCFGCDVKDLVDRDKE